MEKQAALLQPNLSEGVIFVSKTPKKSKTPGASEAAESAKTSRAGASEPNPDFRPSFGDYPRTLPFRTPTADEILSMLGVSGDMLASTLHFTVICDDEAQQAEIIEATIRAGDHFSKLKPAAVRPRAIAQRFFDVAQVQRIAEEEHADAATTGLCMLVSLCKVSKADLVLGVGKQGQGVVTDLKRQAAKMYPDRVGCFMTQADAEKEAAERPFAGEPDAWLLVAFEHLYGVKIDSSGANA